MIPSFEKCISDITKNISCSKAEKDEIALELRDHFYTAYESYISQGILDEKAIQLTLEQFGHSEHIAMQYQQSVNPVYGLVNIALKLLFMIYSMAVLYILIFSRLIVRVLEHIQAEGPYYLRFVHNNKHVLTEKQFFNFSRWQENINLQPFETIVFYLTTDSVNADIAFSNIVNNIMLFIPLGFLLPLLIIKFQKTSALLLCAFCVSYALELLQFGLQLGIADIDDVILNMLGAAIGLLCVKLLLKVRQWKIKRELSL